MKAPLRKPYLTTIRLLTTLIVLATLLQGFPARLASAYSGDYALRFDGVDDFVQLPATNTIMGGASWKDTKTVSLWVRPTGTSLACPFSDVAQCDSIFGDRPNWWGITRGIISGNDRIWIWNYDGSTDRIGIPYTIGEWVHITLLHSGGVLRAYKNGVEVASTPSGTTQQPTTGALPVLQIGGIIMGMSSNFTFEGQIDDIQVWNTARSISEIRRDMYRDLTGGETGLAAYYRMSNGSGTSLTDNSGNSFTGTMSGGPAWIASGAVAGPRNTLDFDGTNDHIVVTDGNPLDLTTSMTVEFWMKADNWSNGLDTAFLTKGNASGTLPNYYFGKSASGVLRFSYYNAGWQTSLDTSGANFSNGVWHHLAFVVDTSNNLIRFYQNGSLLSEVTNDFSLAPMLANDESLAIGAYLNSTDAQFDGQIDELRIWSSPRAEDQIRANMLQTLAGNESGLIAYYRFDQSNAANQTTLYDATPNRLDGSLVSMDSANDWFPSTAFNTWIGSESMEWVTAANWSLYATPGSSDNTGVYNNPGGFIPSLSTPASVNNLFVAAGATLTDNSGGLAVSGNLFNHGSLQQTQNVSGSSDITFLGTGNYGGVTINPQGDNLSSTTVSIRGNQDCTETTSETVKRCFDITPSNIPSGGVDLTFYFDQREESGNSCFEVGAYHWNGTGWDELVLDETYGSGGRVCGSNPQSIRVTGVNSFSPFVLKKPPIPTAVTLLDFSRGRLIDKAGLTTITLFLLGLGLVGIFSLRKKLMVEYRQN